jgi:toxin ParE1/3/4
VPDWRIRITRRAEADIDAALAWTREEFGVVQEARYRATIEAAIGRLVRGPEAPGSRPVHPARPDLRRLHLPRPARRVLIYREAPDGWILVLRILHDSMDLARHLPPDTP